MAATSQKKSKRRRRTKCDRCPLMPAKVAARVYAPPRVSRVRLVGCGGTGAILAEHLGRMIAGYRLNVELELWDGDVVEQRNIGRQNFFPWEVGLNKAEAVALRLAGQFGIAAAARARHLTRAEIAWMAMIGLTVTATDTLTSRRMIAEAIPVGLWLDVGNELRHGQAVLGTTHDGQRLGRQWRQWPRGKAVISLPNIAAMNPKVLKARRTKGRASCADQPFAQQGFGVNALAALSAATIVKQVLVDRVVSTPQIYFNVSDGRSAARTLTRELFEPWKDEAEGKSA